MYRLQEDLHNNVRPRGVYANARVSTTKKIQQQQQQQYYKNVSDKPNKRVIESTGKRLRRIMGARARNLTRLANRTVRKRNTPQHLHLSIT